MWKLRDGEKKEKGRGKEERWLLVQWISEDEEFLLKTNEENAWQLLSLSPSLCGFLRLSPSHPPTPPHLNLSLPPTSGIYMSYWDWIDCTWEVYLTKQLKVQLVHLDERKWDWERCTASFCLSDSASPFYRETVFSSLTKTRDVCGKHLFSMPETWFWHIHT